MHFFQNLLLNFKSASTTPKVTENDFVIFVVGPTGSGKSWFIKELCKSDEVEVAKGQHPRTKDVEASRCNFHNGSDNIVVVDTPSFHTDVDGFDAEGIMTDWIRTRSAENCRGSGILFLHSLARDPTHKDMSMERHLQTFSTFPQGFNAPSRVYVVPTQEPASKLADEKVKLRRSQLEDAMVSLNGNGNGPWHASMFDEVFKGQPEMAWEVVQLLLKKIVSV